MKSMDDGNNHTYLNERDHQHHLYRLYHVRHGIHRGGFVGSRHEKNVDGSSAIESQKIKHAIRLSETL